MVARVKANQKCRENYFDRGITVCERWLTYENFTADMGADFLPELTLDRIDNDGNYEPGNCRWTTFKVQGNNKTTNIYHTLHGKTLTTQEWAEFAGVKYTCLRRRLYQQRWPLERALLTPVYDRSVPRTEFLTWLRTATPEGSTSQLVAVTATIYDAQGNNVIWALSVPALLAGESITKLITEAQ